MMRCEKMKKAISLSLTISILVLSLSVVTEGSVTEESVEEFETRAGMNVPRYNHTSTLLPVDHTVKGPFESLVCVTGGTSDGTSSLDSCEVYRGGKWEIIASMNEPRMRHGAVSIGYELMVTGGFVGAGHPSLIKHFNGSGNFSSSTCEIYDSNSNEWNYVAPMNTGRFWHGILTLDANRVLVIGGSNITHGVLSSCEVYDNRQDTWADFPSLPIPLVRFAYGMDNNGNIIVAGGHNGTEKEALDRVFIFRDGGDAWEEASRMLHPRGYPGYCFIDGDRFVVSGGFSSPGQPDRSDAEVYNFDKDSWEEFGELQFPRHGHDAHYLDGLGILIVGGSNCETGGCHSNMELYNDKEGIWEDTGHLITARKWGASTYTFDDSVLISGGKACNYATNNTEEFMILKIGYKEEQNDYTLLVLITLLIPTLMATAVLIYSKRRL